MASRWGIAVLGLGLLGCGGTDEMAAAGLDSAVRDAAVAADASSFGNPEGLDGASGSRPPTEPAGPASPPPGDLVQTEQGGYALGAALTGDELPSGTQATAGACSMLLAVVRDVRGADQEQGHPDFQVFKGKGATPDLVARELGADGKPVYASRCEAAPDRSVCPFGQQTTSAENFASWYRSVAGVNLPFALHLAFDVNDAVYTFESKAFFPLDGAGFGNSGGKLRHNFSFTTEVHVEFVYRGGERFSFSGDDDLWVFIAGKLALDLGGLHDDLQGTIELDSLGLQPGERYPLDLFHAERHSAGSNFRIDTTLSFTDCGKLTPDVI